MTPTKLELEKDKTVYIHLDYAPRMTANIQNGLTEKYVLNAESVDGSNSPRRNDNALSQNK